MIEKPKRPMKIPNQDNKQPQTIAELIRRYDLDNTKIYDFLDQLVEQLKFKNTQNDNRFDEMKGGTLYEDVIGTTGNVPLSENATNFEYIELFGYRGDRLLYVKVRTNKMYFGLHHSRFVNNGIYNYVKEFSINGKSLDVEYSKFMYTKDGVDTIQDEADTYITRVVGHNKK